ncbi:ATP-binding protein [Thiomicrorhabdus sediminis]|uniref:histidine kinase n=1 Tax=Thiomicrorhabdus sediminis TaxID=2580412 RepID=A0A4P9K4X2_9GAMM|nr:ATP-binding protein [Thiomicrorhabdus sediminis]QCU89801.1 HAMP domain-containing protein [Thiomicrorhabdus sediminis]
MKFRHQFIFSFILIQAVFILLIVLFNMHNLKSSSQKLVAQQIVSSMDLLSEIVKTPMLVGDLATLDDATQNFASFENIIQVSIFDLSGNLLSSAKDNDNSSLSGAKSAKDHSPYFEYQRGIKIPENEKLIQVTYPISIDSETIGSVQFLFDNSQLSEELFNAEAISYGLVLFSIMVGILVAISMGGRITRALHRLIQFAQFIARGEDTPIPKKIIQGNDELASLAQAMNDMQEQIKLRTNSLITAEQKALRANQAKSEFLSSMSHELRTPLNAVIGFSQLLALDELADDQKEYVDEINKAAIHLLDLINEILDFEKIESGKVDLNIQELDVDTLLDECFSLIQPLAKKKNIELRFAQNTDQSIIETDRVRLKQSLVNLLSNAVKYNEDSGFVELACNTEDDIIIFKVLDGGRGIDKKAQKHLFEPFNRLGQETGSIEGTGIGLSITKTLVELMQGRIRFEENSPKGSCFIIEMPIKQPQNNL